MARKDVSRLTTILACAIAAATLLACDSNDTEDAPQNFQIASDSTLCAARSAGDPWWIMTYPAQTGRFHASFQATPSANNIDAVFGVSKGAASTWTKLAAIVRFSPAGVIDVRKGGAYAADVAYPYFAGRTYYVRLDIDISKHTYTVTVSENPSSGTFTTLAKDYPFRTEQAGVTSLDAAAVYLEPSRAGTLTVCDWVVLADDSTPDGCVTSVAGGTFANEWYGGPWNAGVLRFSATPSAANMDGVVGYVAGPADAYNDFAASIRFYTNGLIEARDGDAYRALSPIRYVAGTTYNFYVAIDYGTHTYSVFVLPANDSYDQAVILAENFKFRPQQATVDTTNYLSTVVASSAGQVRVCRVETINALHAVRGGVTRLIGAINDGRYVLSGPSGTQIVDDRSGAVAVTSPTPLDMITYDESGNIYNAVRSATETATTNVQSFTSSMTSRWTKTVTPDGAPTTIGYYGNGVLGMVTWNNQFLVNLRATDGVEVTRRDLRAYQATAVAIGPGRYAFAWRSGNEGILEMHAVDGTKVWERRWTGNFAIDKMVIDPAGGVTFGGSFGDGGIDFGAGWYEPQYSSYVALNGYIVRLESDGRLRYAHRLYAGAPDSLQVGTYDGVTAYGMTQWPEQPYMDVFVFDGFGNPMSQNGALQLTDDGNGHLDGLAVTSDGWVLANTTVWMHPSPNVSRWPLLVTLSP